MRNQIVLDAKTNVNKVQCIKAIRTLTGLGLKEAKDLVELAMTAPQTVNYAAYVSANDIKYAENMLVEAKCELIHGSHIRPRSVFKTKVLVMESVAAGDYVYAAKLLNVLMETESNG